MKRLLTALLIVVLSFGTAHAYDVTLQWDANTEPDLAGYYIYQSTTPDSWDINYRLKDVDGNDIVILPTANPEAVITGLKKSTDYYWVVTAFDDEVPSLESDWSNQVSKIFSPPGNPQGLRFLQQVARWFKNLFSSLKIA